MLDSQVSYDISSSNYLIEMLAQGKPFRMHCDNSAHWKGLTCIPSWTVRRIFFYRNYGQNPFGHCISTVKSLQSMLSTFVLAFSLLSSIKPPSLPGLFKKLFKLP